jgi:hypothetical protein
MAIIALPSRQDQLLGIFIVFLAGLCVIFVIRKLLTLNTSLKNTIEGILGLASIFLYLYFQAMIADAYTRFNVISSDPQNCISRNSRAQQFKGSGPKHMQKSSGSIPFLKYSCYTLKMPAYVLAIPYKLPIYSINFRQAA